MNPAAVTHEIEAAVLLAVITLALGGLSAVLHRRYQKPYFLWWAAGWGFRGETPVEPGNPRARLDALTRRERDVLLGVTRVQTNKEVAAALGLSPRTVESYRESLMRMLGIYTVAGLTRFVVEAGAEG
jgi:DNA-binding NarL/FixJ family response regulator